MQRFKGSKALSLILCVVLVLSGLPLSFGNKIIEYRPVFDDGLKVTESSQSSLSKSTNNESIEQESSESESFVRLDEIPNNYRFISNNGKYDKSVLWYGNFGSNMVFVDNQNTITYLLPDLSNETIRPSKYGEGLDSNAVD